MNGPAWCQDCGHTYAGPDDEAQHSCQERQEREAIEAKGPDALKEWTEQKYREERRRAGMEPEDLCS